MRTKPDVIRSDALLAVVQASQTLRDAYRTDLLPAANRLVVGALR